MKSLLKILLGFNAISLVHLVRLKPKQFIGSCKRAFTSSLNSVHNPAAAIPEISLGKILCDRKPFIRMPVMEYEDGMLPSEQAMALLSILVAESPKEVLEIGTYMGHTTRQIAENLELGTIHTVDLPRDFFVERETERSLPKDDFHLIGRRIVGREFMGHPCACRIIQHFADTAKWDFRDAGHPTFFFIDGSHTYKYCKNDSEKCFGLCGGQGVFLWHDCDYLHPGVARFLSEWRRLGRDIRRISGTALAYWKSAQPG
jgi:hypothetical protein